MFGWLFSLLKRALGYCEGCGVLSRTILCQDCRTEREWARENSVPFPEFSARLPLSIRKYNQGELNQKANGISEEV